ncbi:hypothetical protein [[Mycoplasma] collis]|uniref:hypothetical protein n=1 Tax=[Mycoplasma] collis TaxID=2127 RepID=UPI00051BBE55|nr:hypothetical protein [[Mycoplasma] collis]
MKKQIQSISSSKLNLSFNFVIENYYSRTLEIKIDGLLRDIKYNSSFFDWLIEDLIYLLDQNKYQRRWDYGIIYLSGFESLNLNNEQLEELFFLCKSVTNFDLVPKK